MKTGFKLFSVMVTQMSYQVKGQTLFIKNVKIWTGFFPKKENL